MTIMLVQTELQEAPILSGCAQRKCVVLQSHGRLFYATLTALPTPGKRLLSKVTDEHLRAEPDETDPAWLAIADVIVRSRPAIGSFPGSLLTATVLPDRVRLVATRTGWIADIAAPAPVGIFASFVHAWMVSGRSITHLDGASLVVSGGPCRPVRVTHPAKCYPTAL
jgi:hypothetical protein